MNAKSTPAKEMMPTTSHLGPVLMRHRIELGLPRDVVARRAGLSEVGLHNLETCKSSSKSDNYERVAEAMEIDFALVTLEASLEAQKEKK